jgi:hypothetical protein
MVFERPEQGDVMSAQLKIDTRDLSAWIKREMEYSKKDLATAINWHGFKICKAANAITHAASKAEIRSSLSATSRHGNATIAAILVQLQRRKIGLKGLYGQEMKAAIAAFISKRAGHIKYLGAGFLPGVAIFGAKVGAKIGDNAARWARSKQGDGSPVGGATTAKPSMNPLATFFNDAMSPPDKTTKPQEAFNMKAIALQHAVNQEVGNLEKYVARQIEKRNFRMFSRFIR